MPFDRFKTTRELIATGIKIDIGDRFRAVNTVTYQPAYDLKNGDILRLETFQFNDDAPYFINERTTGLIRCYWWRLEALGNDEEQVEVKINLLDMIRKKQ